MKKLYGIRKIFKSKSLVFSYLILIGIISNIIFVQAEIHDYEDWDYWYDVYDDDYEYYTYDKINKTYDTILISQSTGHTYSVTSLNEGYTDIYPVDIETDTDYIIGLTEETSSELEGSIQVTDEKGNSIYEKELFLFDDGWEKTLSLSEGRYYINILSRDILGFKYQLYIKPKVMIKNDTENHKLESYDKETLDPELGKGYWETSNENVIGIISKNPDNSSTCKVEARKAGKATITYTNDNGSIIKYKYTVSAIKNASKDLRISSCNNRDLKSKVGKGKWKTSNKNIVEIVSKNSDYTSTCKVHAKKPGKATITYTDQYGYVSKYNFTVFAKSTYPLDNAYFNMNSVGGLEPHILISNNSDKKIKYIYLTVSFYNAVGDKLQNEIGWNKNVKLQITGYIKPWAFSWYDWDPVFYEYSATKMKIETMQIIYSDGSKKNMNINKKYSIQS